MPRDLAVILTDASIESAVTTALAAQKYRIALVHPLTDSPNSLPTRNAFNAQAVHFRADPTYTLSLAGLQLPEPGSLPNLLLAQLASITLALQAAVTWDAAAVYLPLRTGPSADDLARGTEYAQIFQELLHLPCDKPGIDILTPLLELDPWQVIDLAVQVDAPLHLTWTCLTPGPTPCQLCPPCLARKEAFHRAAKPDPLLGPEIAKTHEGRREEITRRSNTN